MEQAQGWGLEHLQALCTPAVTATALKWQVQIIHEQPKHESHPA